MAYPCELASPNLSQMDKVFMSILYSSAASYALQPELKKRAVQTWMNE
jgi:hypothetical protein